MEWSQLLSAVMWLKIYPHAQNTFNKKYKLHERESEWSIKLWKSSLYLCWLSLQLPTPNFNSPRSGSSGRGYHLPALPSIWFDWHCLCSVGSWKRVFIRRGRALASHHLGGQQELRRQSQWARTRLRLHRGYEPICWSGIINYIENTVGMIMYNILGHSNLTSCFSSTARGRIDFQDIDL